MKNIIFIGGSGRCGTTILKDVLSLHSKVVVLPFEYRFILDPDGLIDFCQSYSASWSPYLADKKLKRLEDLLKNLSSRSIFDRGINNVLSLFNKDYKYLTAKKYVNWELEKHIPNYKNFAEELLLNLKEFSFRGNWVGSESYDFLPEIYYAPPKTKEELRVHIRSFLKKVFSSLLKKNNGEFYVEDNTWNILFADELLKLLPNSKIIHIYRDPRDVIASFSRQNWAPKDKIKAAKWYRSIMEYWFNVREKLPPLSFREIKLENLVENTESIVRDLCKFIGFSFEKNMLQIDLSKSHGGWWKDEFTIKERKEVTIILEDVIKRLNYPLE